MGGGAEEGSISSFGNIGRAEGAAVPVDWEDCFGSSCLVVVARPRPKELWNAELLFLDASGSRGAGCTDGIGRACKDLEGMVDDSTG